MRKKIYISGKIGEEVLSEATRRKFARAEEVLKRAGYETFNPAASGLVAKADALAAAKGTDFYREILLLDLQALAGCDGIALLPDWADSPGARAEYMFAAAIGLETILI